MEKIGIIADDLTGAIDSGVRFSNCGCRTLVVLEPARLRERIGTTEVIVISTESRNLSPIKARQSLRRSVQELKDLGIKNFYKKIDSTLRGNIGSELDELIKLLQPGYVFIAPAFPDNERLTVNGYQLVKGKPVTETEIADDLLSPIKDSYIPALLEDFNYPVKVINTEKLYSPDLEADLSDRKGSETEIVIIDIKNNQDLTKAAEQIRPFKDQSLLCGSAGLAGEITRIWELEQGKKMEKEDLTIYKNNEKTIVLAGSIKETTKRQLDYAEARGIDLVEIDTRMVLGSGNKKSKELERSLRLSKRVLKEKDEIIISLKKISTDKKRDVISDSRTILRWLARLLSQLLQSFAVEGLVLTGGDTAVSICKELGVTGILIKEEVTSGIPAGILLGGDYEGIRIITKAGAFGSEEDIFKAIKYLKGGGSNE